MINQSQLEPEEIEFEPKQQPLLLPKQLMRRIIQIQEQQSPSKNPERFLEHPQSLFIQPVAAKSLILLPPIYLMNLFDTYYACGLVWFHFFI